MFGPGKTGLLTATARYACSHELNMSKKKFRGSVIVSVLVADETYVIDG